jgi:methylmalonyl-CoA/ethylmalonyl-CoA epimerase
MVKRIHHIDYVVRDLDRAVERYRAILGAEPFPRERLESRGIEAVRFKVGESFLILVQPVAPGPVQAFLDARGEGFFHIAYEVDEIEAEAERLEAAGVAFRDGAPRRGLEGWKLMDLDPASTFGVECQLAEPAR